MIPGKTRFEQFILAVGIDEDIPQFPLIHRDPLLLAIHVTVMLLSVIEIFKTMTALRNAEICQRDFKSTTCATRLSFIFLIMVLVGRIHTYDAHQSCTGKNRSNRWGQRIETLKGVSHFLFSDGCIWVFPKIGVFPPKWMVFY